MSDEVVSNAELARLIVRMEQKVEHVYTDHEVRLRRLERIIWTMSGLAGAGAATGASALLTSGIL